ncbi:MAG: class I SAM-dependent methyltransferase [Paracoccaceae bacterium]
MGAAKARPPFVKHIHAIDVSTKMLELAEVKVKAATVSNLTLACADIEKFSENGAKYDVIMGHAILHLLDDKGAVIAMVYNMLKPGGNFVSSTVCMGTRWSPLRVGLILGENLGQLLTVRYFSIEGIEQSLTDVGFTIDHQWAPENSDAVFIVAKKQA